MGARLPRAGEEPGRDRAVHRIADAVTAGEIDRRLPDTQIEFGASQLPGRLTGHAVSMKDVGPQHAGGGHGSTGRQPFHERSAGRAGCLLFEGVHDRFRMIDATLTPALQRPEFDLNGGLRRTASQDGEKVD